MAKVKRRKSSVSAREKRARRARAAREARRGAQLERELQHRLEELFGGDTPPERAAALWLERLDGDAVPVKVSRLVAVTASTEHAHAVSAAMDRLSPGSVPALSLAADIAFQLDGDARRASALLDHTLETAVDAEARVALADHLLELGRVADALALVEAWLLDFPGDEDAQQVRARALELAHRRLAGDGDVAPDKCPCWSGRSWSGCCRLAEMQALERFGDRRRLHGLRDAMRRFTASAADVHYAIADHIERWLSDADKFVHDADTREAVAQAATEHAWLVAGEHEDDDEDAPLILFGFSRFALAEDAAAARRWIDHCQYGLWQISDPTPAPGVWVVDLLTGTRRYVAIPTAQLEGIGRWTVLLGALVAIDGTWRTASTLVPLRPTEADGVAELAEELMYHVASAASGKQIKGAPPRRWRDEPAGVLAAQGDPVRSEVATFASQVLGSGMPQLLAMIGELRGRAPKLVNTDQDPLCLINAIVHVRDPRAAAERLSSHPDIRDQGDDLTWWGRELDHLERASTHAEVRSLLRERGEDPDAIELGESQRWLRGRIKPLEDGLAVDVNSRERLERFLSLLRELGEQPVVSNQLLIDPAQDMPQVRAGQLLSLGGSEESQAAWLAQFPDQPLPALDGRTPRQAARRPQDAPRLEALLRELEYDADVLVSRGMPAPDIGHLRQELQAPASAWL
jgi:hypothetical protein